jgi:hypothetical protein
LKVSAGFCFEARSFLCCGFSDNNNN